MRDLRKIVYINPFRKSVWDMRMLQFDDYRCLEGDTRMVIPNIASHIGTKY